MKKLSKDQEVIQLVQQYFMVSSGDQKMEDATEKTINAAFNFIVSYSRFVTTSIFPFNPSYPGGWGGGGQGTLCPQGQSPDHWGLTRLWTWNFMTFHQILFETKDQQKKFCGSSTFCTLGLLSGTGETHRLSVMCQLVLGFCNLKRLFESNVLFSFTG